MAGGWVSWVAAVYAAFVVGLVGGVVSRRLVGGRAGVVWGRVLDVVVYPVVVLAGLNVGGGLAGIAADWGLGVAVAYYGVVPALAGVVAGRVVLGWLGVGGGRG